MKQEKPGERSSGFFVALSFQSLRKERHSDATQSHLVAIHATSLGKIALRPASRSVERSCQSVTQLQRTITVTTGNSREGTDISEDFAQVLLEKYEQLPAQYSLETYKELEAKFEKTRIARRIALLTLTKPFSELRDDVVADRELAIAIADIYNGLESTIETMLGMVEIMETSRNWQMMALVHRADMKSILEKAGIN